MPLRKLNIREVARFEYSFGPPITAQMADIGRALGSASIGLAIQTGTRGSGRRAVTGICSRKRSWLSWRETASCTTAMSVSRLDPATVFAT